MGFFEQFEKLRLHVPRLALMNFEAKASPFCNFTFQCENTHYSMGSDFLKGCSYNYWGYHNTDCVDCSYCRNCEGCYECIDCKNCCESTYLQDCEDCTDSWFCFDCQSLRDCFACIGLWRKQYYIYNKPYNKEDYYRTVNKLKHKPPEELRKLFREVKKQRPHIAMRESHNEYGCTGDYVFHSRACEFCFDVDHCSESAYLNNAINCSNSFDISFAGEPPLKNCYEIMSGMGLDNSSFCSSCWHGKNLEYCEYSFQCEFCFGCIGLKNRKFYILNIAYRPDEYFRRVAEIKESMKREDIYGKWFPSVYPLEDTLANEPSLHILHSFNGKGHAEKLS